MTPPAIADALAAIGVVDPRVLRAMAAVPRRRFVPPAFADEAEVNTPLPIGLDQTISAPDVVGLMTQALRVEEGDRVLDVGTGSGYQAAVLAEMGCRVLSIELLRPLADEARTRLRDLGYGEVEVLCGDGTRDLPTGETFDGIVVAAAPERVPPSLVAALGPGARLVIPVGPEGGAQRLLVVRRRADGGVDSGDILGVRFVPLRREAVRGDRM